MNQINAKRYEKKLLSKGVPKYLAREMVEVAMDISYDDNLDMAIDYALTLTYGLNMNVAKKSVDNR